MAKTIGEIIVTFDESGDVNIKVEGKITYMMQYGVAATLHELARVEQAKQTMASMMGMTPGGLVAPGTAVPSDLRRSDG